MRYLLDTMVLIDHAAGDPVAIALMDRLFEEGHDLYTCDVVTCESLSRGEPADLKHIGALLDALEYVSTTPVAARRAGAARRERHARGGKRVLGDALIAAIAVDLAATVVTRNRPDFERQGVRTLTY